MRPFPPARTSMRTPLLLALLLSAAALSTPSAAQAPARDTPAPAVPGDPADPYIWLESFGSSEAMAWVEARNKLSTGRLEADRRYPQLYQEALTIASARDRIPQPSFTHGEIFNFWNDAEHLRGIWRKTSLESYRTGAPQWTTVIDVDALGKAEGKSWVWHGARCLQPEQKRCLIGLSDGGEDAEVVREFDLDTGRFVEGGFVLPRGKHRIAWEDENTLLVASEWTPGDLTPSGYPYIVKRLKRGQPLSAAVEVYRGGKADGGYGVSPQQAIDGQGRRFTYIVRPLDTFRHETYAVTPAGVKRMAVPLKSDVADLVDGRVIVSLDEPWAVAGKSFGAGAVVQMDLAAVQADPGALKPALIWAPGPREALDGVRSSRDKLLIETLDNVQPRLWAYTPAANGGWTRAAVTLPPNVSAGFGAADDKTNRAFVNVSSFTTPNTLALLDADTMKVEPLKALPAKFDATGLVTEQFEATSTDGTRVPYFVVHRRDVKLDGSTPTLMTAYGGFQVSQTPGYSAVNGKLWLEKGGAYVLANIRGGGEFGPKWHEAGLGTKRQIVYDDFASVARDLFRRKITSPRRLGIEGGSNGGLLMGVEFTQHPELWNAVVIAVPLLDMIRISKIAAGASWQGEYGEVYSDPAVRAFWLKTSPYHQLKATTKYPEPFIWTTTKDDRVGPQHARKFAARMEELKLPYLYFENTEGGHGSGADLKQRARQDALTMTYLHQKLFD